MRRIQGNDCGIVPEGDHSARDRQVRRGKTPDLGHRDLVPKAGLARGYDPLKEREDVALIFAAAKREQTVSSHFSREKIHSTSRTWLELFHRTSRTARRSLLVEVSAIRLPILRPLSTVRSLVGVTVRTNRNASIS